ncbi:uncharacterized protein FFFS_15872 [Fusarium fujikuroi]|nr:uncharacterized protein FFFS_15872 [Fusarium fujikuroi]
MGFCWQKFGESLRLYVQTEILQSAVPHLVVLDSMSGKLRLDQKLHCSKGSDKP